MADGPIRSGRPVGFLAGFGAALGAVACIAVFIILGFWMENRLLQGIAALAAGVALWQAPALAAFYRRLWQSMLGGARRRHQGIPMVAATVLFCGLVLWGLLNNLINPQYGVSLYSHAPVVAAAAAVLVLLPAIYGAAAGAAKFLGPRKLLRIGFLVIFFAAFFALQLRIGFAVRIPPGWDAQAVLDSAAGLATGSIDSLDPRYFASFSNNLALTLALARYFQAAILFGATDLLFAGVFLNCVVLTLGAVLTYVVARRVGNEAAALFTLLPSTVLVLLSPWIMVPYSDALGLLFPILLFYLYLVQAGAQSRAVKLLVQAAMGVTAAIGYNVKPTIIIVLLAIGAVAVLGSLADRPTKRRLLAAFTAVAIVTGSYAAGSAALTTAMDASDAVTFDLKNNDQTFPAAHYLNMGAEERDSNFNPFYGAWSAADVKATAAMPPEERTERNIASYLGRVQAMGVSGYLSFLSAKFIWFLGDGSFFLWGEGTAASRPFIAEDALSQEIQSYYGFHGENYETLIGMWQTAWFALLALLCLPLFAAKRALFSRPATIMRVALLGLFVFLLLFEARSRYLYLYVPFFIVLASLSASAFSTRGDSGASTATAAAGQQDPPTPEEPVPPPAGPAVVSADDAGALPGKVGSVSSADPR